MSNSDIVLDEAILNPSPDAAYYEHSLNAAATNIMTIWTLDGRNDRIPAEGSLKVPCLLFAAHRSICQDVKQAAFCLFSMINGEINLMRHRSPL